MISTGGSSLECVDALREAGCEVIGMVAIFTYGLPKATVNFEVKECSFVTLTNYDILVEVAVENDYIQSNDLEKLKAWKKDPSDETWLNKSYHIHLKREKGEIIQIWLHFSPFSCITIEIISIFEEDIYV